MLHALICLFTKKLYISQFLLFVLSNIGPLWLDPTLICFTVFHSFTVLVWDKVESEAVAYISVRFHTDVVGPLVGEGGGHVPDQPATADRQPTRRRRQTQAGGHFVLLIILTIYIYILV